VQHVVNWEAGEDLIAIPRAEHGLRLSMVSPDLKEN
jgi:hypothetical protein